jgi:chromate transport protein ChrA
MDFSGAGITYLLLIIPTLFALSVVGQGAVKVNRDEKDGKLILGLGIVFLVLILLAHFFFIK